RSMDRPVRAAPDPRRSALIRGGNGSPAAQGMTIDTVRLRPCALRWPLHPGSFDMTRPLTLALGAGLLGATLLAGCATTARTGDDGALAASADPYPSTYAPIASPPGLIPGATLLAGCATTARTGDDGALAASADPYPSTYAPIASPPVLISGATVLTGTGTRLDGADVLLQGGRIAAIGTGLTAPADAVRVD